MKLPKMTRIAELSWQIQQHVHAIDAALTARGEQSPSWNLDTPPAVGVGSEEIQESQIALLETVEELVALVLGPVPWLLNKATDEVCELSHIIRFCLGSRRVNSLIWSLARLNFWT